MQHLRDFSFREKVSTKAMAILPPVHHNEKVGIRFCQPRMSMIEGKEVPTHRPPSRACWTCSPLSPARASDTRSRGTW